ncbi:MAG: Ig-like domain-containing protein [Elusimicrobiaceae bacterium]|nr:Ig-like domain-containing protein [Elusimicrobiaceae bacterium]
MKKIHAFAVAVLLNMVFAACGWAQVRVLSVSPDGLLRDGETPGVVTVMFSEPMVALGAASHKLPCPFLLEPAVSGVCRWADTATAVFTPDEPFEFSRVYKVTVPKGVKAVSGSALAGEVRRAFVTPLVRLLGSDPQNGARWVSRYPTVFLRFNQPVRYDAARNFITLADSSGSKIPCGVRKAKPEEVEKLFPPYITNEGEIPPSTATVLAVKPVLALKPDSEYFLAVAAGLPGAGGAGARLAEGVRFYTYGGLEFKGVSASSGCLPANYAVKLSNPVRYSDFAEHLAVPDGLKKNAVPAYISGGFGFARPAERAYSYQLDWLDFEPGRTYDFTLTKGLKDVFGNTLPADRTFSVTAGDYCPRVSFAGGFGVLENMF